MKYTRFLSAALLISALSITALSISAQDATPVATAEATGQVSDPTGSAVAGAIVKMIETARGVSHDTTTDSTGRYNPKPRTDRCAHQADVIDRGPCPTKAGGGFDELGAGVDDQLACGDFLLSSEQGRLDNHFNQAFIGRFNHIPELAQDVRKVSVFETAQAIIYVRGKPLIAIDDRCRATETVVSVGRDRGAG